MPIKFQATVKVVTRQVVLVHMELEADDLDHARAIARNAWYHTGDGLPACVTKRKIQHEHPGYPVEGPDVVSLVLASTPEQRRAQAAKAIKAHAKQLTDAQRARKARNRKGNRIEAAD